jgi:hypothetical protein
MADLIFSWHAHKSRKKEKEKKSFSAKPLYTRHPYR